MSFRERKHPFSDTSRNEVSIAQTEGEKDVAKKGVNNTEVQCKI